MLKSEIINLMIGCCISADNNFTNEERQINIEALKKILKEEKLSKEQTICAEQGIKILEEEIEDGQQEGICRCNKYV